MKRESHEELLEHKKSPFIYFLALFLILMLVFMVVPNYSIRLDPEPDKIPKLADMKDMLPKNLTLSEEREKTIFANQYNKYLEPNNPAIKQIASKIASQSCDSNKVCQAKAVYYFVRDNIDYVGDPPDEYIETPLETLSTGGADCDGMAVLLANLEQAIGIKTRFVFIPRHVYVQVYIEEALNKYKDETGWINLDPTCDSCDFGEIPYQNLEKEKRFV